MALCIAQNSGPGIEILDVRFRDGNVYQVHCTSDSTKQFIGRVKSFSVLRLLLVAIKFAARTLSSTSRSNYGSQVETANNGSEYDALAMVTVLL